MNFKGPNPGSEMIRHTNVKRFETTGADATVVNAAILAFITANPNFVPMFWTVFQPSQNPESPFTFVVSATAATSALLAVAVQTAVQVNPNAILDGCSAYFDTVAAAANQHCAVFWGHVTGTGQYGQVTGTLWYAVNV